MLLFPGEQIGEMCVPFKQNFFRKGGGAQDIKETLLNKSAQLTRRSVVFEDLSVTLTITFPACLQYPTVDSPIYEFPISAIHI